MVKRRVGRPFKNNIDKKTGLVLAISIPAPQYPLLLALNRLSEEMCRSRSSIVCDALSIAFGSEDMNDVEDLILNKYADKIYAGPRLFKTFDDVLEWELKQKSISQIAVLWHVSFQTLGKLMYRYCAGQQL